MQYFKYARYLAPLVLLLSTGGAAAIAADGVDWAGVKQLSPGQETRVSLIDGKSYQGAVVSANDETLVIHLAAADRTLARENIRRVSVKRNGHRGRHALVGAAIGAGAGLGIGAAIDSSCSGFCDNKGKPLGAALFALLGAGVGALLPAGGWQEIYRSR
jgi:hypothetical protein